MVGMYTVLPIPSSPSNDQWVSPWRAAGPPNKGQREHRVEGCRRGAMAGGGGQAALVSRALQPGSQPVLSAAPQLLPTRPLQTWGPAVLGDLQKGQGEGEGTVTEPCSGPRKPPLSSGSCGAQMERL